MGAPSWRRVGGWGATGPTAAAVAVPSCRFMPFWTCFTLQGHVAKLLLICNHLQPRQVCFHPPDHLSLFQNKIEKDSS